MRFSIIVLIVLLLKNPVSIYSQEKESFPTPKIEFNPKHYICYQANFPLKIDGKHDEPIWQQTDWTDDFVDIEGDLKPRPRFRTRAKMLWDADYFYVAAELEEPDIWATLTERDAVIFYDNDFEIFIDPDGDTHEYYEFEMNAFNTVWDLLLIKPYRDGGPAVNAWDIQGLKTGVFIDGTINQPGDRDKFWSVEVALPWQVLKECAHRDTPPKNGDQWRVNFSRVEWQVEVSDGKYRKVVNPATGKPFPEDNWVWSPQGLINMHYPEMWGFVQFSDKIAGQEKDEFQFDPKETAKWTLRQIYYQERNYFEQLGRYTDELSKLNLKKADLNLPSTIHTTPNLFEATLKTGEREIRITQDGRTMIK
ncbi:MAG: carbohydrate-binding family 9-like protein [candidate division KSB1 bacterium]|nr:carbohydrate-binding family 9-like protein [candidate division KSB1 bacterium]